MSANKIRALRDKYPNLDFEEWPNDDQPIDFCFCHNGHPRVTIQVSPSGETKARQHHPCGGVTPYSIGLTAAIDMVDSITRRQ